jgi:hypothetical protein
MLYRHGERSQVVKAVDCDSTIRGFDPRRSPSFSRNLDNIRWGFFRLKVCQLLQDCWVQFLLRRDRALGNLCRTYVWLRFAIAYNPGCCFCSVIR